MLSAYVTTTPSSAQLLGAVLPLPGSHFMLGALAAAVVIGSGVLLQKVLVARSARRFPLRVFNGGVVAAPRRAA
jgi:hypothetical protein